MVLIGDWRSWAPLLGPLRRIVRLLYSLLHPNGYEGYRTSLSVPRTTVACYYYFKFGRIDKSFRSRQRSWPEHGAHYVKFNKCRYLIIKCWCVCKNMRKNDQITIFFYIIPIIFSSLFLSGKIWKEKSCTSLKGQ